MGRNLLNNASFGKVEYGTGNGQWDVSPREKRGILVVKADNQPNAYILQRVGSSRNGWAGRSFEFGIHVRSLKGRSQVMLRIAETGLPGGTRFSREVKKETPRAPGWRRFRVSYRPAGRRTTLNPEVWMLNKDEYHFENAELKRL